MQPFSTHRSTHRDTVFICHLQRIFSDQLGFIPTQGIEAYASHGWALIGRENEQHAGYILGRNQYRWNPLLAPITQAAIAMDAQRRKLGLALVSEWCDAAKHNQKLAVQAICANNIDAMLFWPAAGFVPIVELNPDNARGRKVTVWRKCFPSRVPEWFWEAPPVSGYRARKTAPGQLFLFNNSGSASAFRR